MLSSNDKNSEAEVQALKILNTGYLPEIQESEFLNRWLPRLVSDDWRSAINAWIIEVSKNAHQKVSIVRGREHVIYVPAILAHWPTEQVANAKDSISELAATSQAMAARIPMSGVTNLRQGLAQQFDRVNSSPVIEQVKQEHQKAWSELFAHYKVKAPATSSLVSNNTQPSVEIGELLIDEEL